MPLAEVAGTSTALARLTPLLSAYAHGDQTSLGRWQQLADDCEVGAANGGDLERGIQVGAVTCPSGMSRSWPWHESRTPQ